jgi:hypothetical protein
VAANGTMLEQAQILTTHNLAPLVDALNLREQIAAAALELTDRSFTWLVGRLAVGTGNRHARLQAVKNAASHGISGCVPGRADVLTTVPARSRRMAGQLR